MKLILMLLFLSDFWLSILNLKNIKKLKKDKQIINANSVGRIFAYQKMRKKKQNQLLLKGYKSVGW